MLGGLEFKAPKPAHFKSLSQNFETSTVSINMRDGKHMLVLFSRERNGVDFSNILLQCICYNNQYGFTTYDSITYE